MRANKIEPYKSILQVLDMPGCPICRFIKNYQSILVQQKTNLAIRHLCNFHIWAVAATQQNLSAAELFQTLLRSGSDSEIQRACDICLALRTEEGLRIEEFIRHIDSLRVAQWFRSGSAICQVHGNRLESLVSPAAAGSIVAMMDDYRNQLGKQLSSLCANGDPDSTNWGVLGHVAEFLVSQRGLRP